MRKENDEAAPKSAPPAIQLAEIEKVWPGSVERLLRMAEQESAHAREVDMLTVKAAVVYQYLAQIFAVALFVATIVIFARHGRFATVATSIILVKVVPTFLQRN